MRKSQWHVDGLKSLGITGIDVIVYKISCLDYLTESTFSLFNVRKSRNCKSFTTYEYFKLLVVFSPSTRPSVSNVQATEIACLRGSCWVCDTCNWCSYIFFVCISYFAPDSKENFTLDRDRSAIDWYRLRF